MDRRLLLACGLLYILLITIFPTSSSWAFSSNNIALDSPLYGYLDKLAGYGLIGSDFKGIRPFSKSEAARLLLEAQQRIEKSPDPVPPLVGQLMVRIRELIPREVLLKEAPDMSVPPIVFDPKSSMRLRYAYLDGAPRDYERQVHDPGDDGVFGIGSGLRPKNPPDFTVTQRGTEGTPLSPYNNGIVYKKGHNAELRWAVEGHIDRSVSGLLETSLLYTKTGSSTDLELNRGYLKLGGGSLEFEAGKDENWLGLGYRGAITLTNNAENFTQVKLSSPEPFRVKYIGDMKFVLIASRFDRSVTDGQERQPWFYALKLSAKPTANLEIGFNLGRQLGGTGVSNSLGDTLRGLLGGTGADNSNGLAGFEMRYRIPWLRNTELYGEFSGEDAASFWPIVESYVAGIFIPRLTDDGRNDFRFEFFHADQILYTNSTFPGGYLNNNMPIGHSQGGATRDYYSRFCHWFGVRNNLALEYIYTTRGETGRISGQSVEHKHAGRVSWTLPLYGDLDAQATYGIEKISNLNLESGEHRTNQLVTVELRYRY
jgi:hypothetical protein